MGQGRSRSAGHDDRPTGEAARRYAIDRRRTRTSRGREAITLKRLERAARALDCTLVYTLVPRKPLETLVQERAHQVARKRIQTVSHSMLLENQSVPEDVEREQLERLARQLIDGGGSRLLDER